MHTMYRSLLPNARNLLTKSPTIPSRTPSPIPHPIDETSRMLHTNCGTHHSGATQLNQPFGSEGFVKSLDFSSDVVTNAADKVNTSIEQAEKHHHSDHDGGPQHDFQRRMPYGRFLERPQQAGENSYKLKRD